MADERAGAEGPHKDPATENKIQTGGRKENAAQPLNAAPDDGGPERYPAVDRTDGVQAEPRSFGAAPNPRQGAGDGATPASVTDGRFGPCADPAEGKRDDGP
jgi:hypothetical protein